MTKSVEQRFWEKVDKRSNDECWNWLASTNTDGYGHLNINNKTRPAHRLIWEWYYGKIIKPMQVLHKCDNRKCVNPNHLFLGTQQDNIQDMINKNRQKCFDYDQRGENHSHNKLTNVDIINIRKQYKNGNITQRELAKKYNVGQSQINRIINKKNWGHI